uniref:GAGA-binding transcriptional activator n=1 Tax=Wollemia nobilis TaxID=56998 RepID=A0A0C9S8E0_9CONI
MEGEGSTRLEAEQWGTAGFGHGHEHEQQQGEFKVILILAERDAAIVERNTALAEKKAVCAERDAALMQRDVAYAELNSAIMERDAAIAALYYIKNGTFNGRLGTDVGAKILQLLAENSLSSFALRESHHHYHHHQQHELQPHPEAVDAVTVTSTDPSVMTQERQTQNSKQKEGQRKRKPHVSGPPRPRKRGKQASGSGGEDSDRPLPVAVKHEWKDPNGGGNSNGDEEEEKGGVRMRMSTPMEAWGVPIPGCSCTGVLQQCYRWGNGGWQSACCTTKISMYPLPMNPRKKGARVPGRKMSGGAFRKLLRRLTAQGHNLSQPIDLKSHWAKHGTNRYVTIK